MTIGACFPDAVGRLEWPWANVALRGFAPDTVEGIREFTLAQDPLAIRSAIEKIEDLFLT